MIWGGTASRVDAKPAEYGACSGRRRRWVQQFERLETARTVVKPNCEEGSLGDVDIDPASDAEQAAVAGLVGRRLGRYRVLSRLGTGAMGHVFRAHDEVEDRPAAVKVLQEHVTRDGRASSLYCEAHAARAARAPHVVEIYDVGTEPDGTSWLAMELLSGANLDELLHGEGVALRRAIAIGQQVCEALHEVHRAGVVHCDVKPLNACVVRRGGCDFVKLLDFGIARVADWPSTSDAIMAGSPPYMAPEQIACEPTDARTDIHALGALIFELVTGRLPFTGNNVLEVLEAVRQSTPPSVSDYTRLPSGVGDSLDSIVRACLAKRPEHRPADAQVVGLALDRLLQRLDASPMTTAAA